jgi:hypothetical protein
MNPPIFFFRRICGGLRGPDNCRQVAALNQQIDVARDKLPAALLRRQQMCVDGHAADHFKRNAGVVQRPRDLFQLIDEGIHSRLE